MNEAADQERAEELLQQLGLKEYEAKSFVALSRLPRGTAKEISEISDVPRTRVYDAIRVLESKGLAEVQHSNPQQFRAVPIDEAVETLRSEYAQRAESLRRALEGLEPVVIDQGVEVTHEVWALSGDAAITSRTRELIEGAEREIVLVIGHEAVFSAALADDLEAARERGIEVVVGTIDDSLREDVEAELPGVEVFVSGLEWLSHAAVAGDDTEISRLVLIDRETILVSSFVEVGEQGREHEQAVFGRGFDNGLVAIVRRLMATGFLAGDTAAD